MNKKFLSAILFGALMVTSTGTFVSCKDYDDDIDAINKELTDVKSQIAALEGKISAGKWITSVAQTAGGFTISLNDGTSYEVKNGKDGINGTDGVDGADGTVWTISEDGYWVCDGEKTDVKAVGKDGADGKDGINGTDGKDGVDGKDAQPEVKKENGKWYLWNGTEFEEVKVEAPAPANIPYYFTDPSDANYAVLVVWDANGENKKEIRLPLNEGLAQIQVLGSGNFNIKYGISKEGENWARWDGSKAKPAKGELMVGQSPKVIRVQVTPANYDLSAADLKLVNSLGEELPVELGKAVAVKELMTTRSVSPVGIFDIPVIETEITEETTEAYGTPVNFFVKGSEKVHSTYNYSNAFSLALSEDKTQTVIFGYVYEVDGNSFYTTKPLIAPGADCEVEAVEHKAYLYDSYITMADNAQAKADSIRYGITFDGMTIKSNDNAVGKVNFTIHYINVAGGVKTQDFSVTYGVEEEEKEIAIFDEIASIEHTAIKATDADGNKLQYMIVDLKPYFDTMTASERLVWNDEFNGFGHAPYVDENGIEDYSVKAVWENPETGKEETASYWMIQGFEALNAEGEVAEKASDVVAAKVYFVNNYNGWLSTILENEASLSFMMAVNSSVKNENAEYVWQPIQYIEVPFTIAAPSAETLAAAYTLNPSFNKDGVITVYSDKILSHQIASAGKIQYEAAEDSKVEVDNDGTVTLATDGKYNTAYALTAQVQYAGAWFDVADINVMFATSNDYVVTPAAAVSLLSGSGQNSTVYYGKKANKDDVKNYYLAKDLLDNAVDAANITGLTVEIPAAYDEHVTYTVDGNKNITFIATAGKDYKVAVDTVVAVKVTFYVNGEKHEMTLNVTLKA